MILILDSKMSKYDLLHGKHCIRQHNAVLDDSFLFACVHTRDFNQKFPQAKDSRLCIVSLALKEIF